MARMTDNASGEQANNNHQDIRLDAFSDSSLTLPNNGFIVDAEIIRDDQDLILRGPDNTNVVIENYFLAEPSPLLVAHGGAALTPDLVHSFVQPANGVQFAQNGTMNDESPVGLVKETSGEATITHPDGTVVTATAGASIYEGDIIETKGGGAVNITFADETTFSVSENARLAIDEYVYDSATQSGENSFSVLRGIFAFTSGIIGREDPDDVQIDTPVGSIGIRGTTIIGTIDPNGQSHITVVEGAIVIENGSGQMTLSDQYETARLDGFDSPIQNEGVLSGSQVAENYNVLRTVSPSLFSPIDDTASEDSGSDPTTPADDAQPDASSSSPAENPATEESPADDGASLNQQMNTIVASETDAGFDVGAQELKESAAEIVTAKTSAMPSMQVIADNVPMAKAIVEAKTLAAVQAPPAVLMTHAQNQTQSQASQGNQTTSPPEPATALSLNNFITANGAVYPNMKIDFIASPANTTPDYRMGESIINISQGNFAFSREGFGSFFINTTGYSTSSLYGMTEPNAMTMAAIGDFNGDGINDFALGFPEEGSGNNGSVVIVNGANPSQFIKLNGFDAGSVAFPEDGQHGGYSISGVGDFNGDGYSDLMIGAIAGESWGTEKVYMIYGRGDRAWGETISVDDTQGGLINHADPDGMHFIGGTATGMGHTMANVGDLNNDGFSELVFQGPASFNKGVVLVQYGVADTTGGVGPGQFAVTQIGIDSTDADIPVAGLGNFSGYSSPDLAIVEATTNTVHVFLGESISPNSSRNITQSDIKITTSAAIDEIIGVGSAGNFNGTGNNDIAVAVRSGSLVDIYIVYGGNTGSTIDLNNLANFAGHHVTLNLNDPKFDLNGNYDDVHITFTSLGDRNQDGFDDLAIGIPSIDNDGLAGTHTDSGGIIVVHGRASPADAASDKIIDSVYATKNGQVLLGVTNDYLSDSANGGTTIFNGLSIRGLSGNDTIDMFASAQNEIDGGVGLDTLRFMGTSMNINLDQMGSHVKSIEKFQYAADGMSVTIGIDDIFRLLQESENNKLVFDAGNGTTSNTLTIDSNRGETSLANLGFSYQGSDGTYANWSFGGYTLQIDTDLTTNVIA